MTANASLSNAQNLIDCLRVAGAITEEQQETLKNALAEAGSKSREQILADSGFFSQSQLTAFSIPLKVLDEERTSPNTLALYLMTYLQGGKSLEAALDGLESFATPPEPPGLLPIIDALFGAKAMDKLQLEDLKKRMKASPGVPWDEHLLALDILTPRQIECAKLGQSLMEQGEISKSQFAVSWFDEITNSMKFEQSLQTRGWWQKTPS